MRIEGQRESENIEDRRGMGPARLGGKGGLGIGTIVLALAVSYFTGANPLTILNLLTGVQSVTQVAAPSTESGPVGAPGDQLGKFASVVLADTETTWRTLGDNCVSRPCGWLSGTTNVTGPGQQRRANRIAKGDMDGT